MSNFIGTGWAFPIQIDSQGHVARSSDHDVIEQSIQLILGTVKGSRIMRPDFGSDLADFVFKPLNESNKTRMATTVNTALQKWEPRIRVTEITVSSSPQDKATALISIEYMIRRTNTKGNLVYPFYLGGTNN